MSAFMDNASLTQPGINVEDDTRSILKGVIFQFVGQGVLKVGIASELYNTDITFRSTLERCDKFVKANRKYGILELLYPNDNDLTTQNLLQETQYAQPILVSIECSIADMLKSKGIYPEAVLGHSIGEYAACYSAGLFTLEDCLKLVCERGRLTEENLKCRGVMAALRATPETILKAIETSGQKNFTSLAAVNGHQSVVLSGNAESTDRVLKELNGVSHRMLNVKNAFHSPLMECILPEYSEILNSIQFKTPSSKIFSTVKGAEYSDSIRTTEYWLDHITGTVHYKNAVESAWNAGLRNFIEIGPDNTLSALSRTVITFLNARNGLKPASINDGKWLSGLNPEMKPADFV